MVSKQLIEQIDRVIKQVWINEIKKDYNSLFLLQEDTLKCSLYYHLRKELNSLLVPHNLRIYTEYYFPKLQYRADIVIVAIDPESNERYLKEMVTDVIAVFELKFGNYYAEKYIKTDVPKLKMYVQQMPPPCQFYFAAIFEAECEHLRWFDKRQTNNWALGRVTELDAGYLNDTMIFEVNSYNGMNSDLISNTLVPV